MLRECIHCSNLLPESSFNIHDDWRFLYIYILYQMELNQPFVQICVKCIVDIYSDGSSEIITSEQIQKPAEIK